MFQRQVNYLGSVISFKGYHIDQASINAATDLLNQKPYGVGEVRWLLGPLAYHRRYIDTFAKTTQPLYDLLRKPVTTSSSQVQLSKTVAANKDPSQLKSSTPFTWYNNHQRAIEKLMHTVTSPPLLSYPDFHQPFILYVNASTKGLGYSLYQQNRGKFYVLGFGRRALSKSEKRYHSSKLEFLALKRAVFSHFWEYVPYPSKGEADTGNNSLVYFLESAKLSDQLINCGWMSWLV